MRGGRTALRKWIVGCIPMSVAARGTLDAESAQVLAERVAARMFDSDRASQSLGMRIESIAPGRAELAMSVRDDMVNGHAICHGGYIFLLADSTFAFACNSYNRNTVAQGCSIDFLAPAHLGDALRARGVERSRTGRTGVYDIEVLNQHGKTVALFRGKSYRIDGQIIDES
jgi:acyl-CoA thioesterase